MSIAVEQTEDDALLARHYRLHWSELENWQMRPDWEERFHAFLSEARRKQLFQAFAANADGAIVSTACCHEVGRVFPPFRDFDADRLGYVWSVYVGQEHRNRGVGRALVIAALNHLRAIGCGRILLHTGDRSRPLYERIGFFPTDEMAIDASDF